MREVLVKIYKFDELKENIKEKLIESEKLTQIEKNFYSLNDDLENYLEEKYNIKNIEIDYSLGYCQGDGVCFYKKSIINSNIVNNKDSFNANIFEEFLINCDVVLENDIDLVKYDYHYSHFVRVLF